MLTEPISFTPAGGTAKSLPRVQIKDKEAIYQSADGLWAADVAHQVVKSKDGKERVRHRARFDQRKVVTDPITSVMDYDTATVNLSIERPAYGFTVAEIDALVQGFKAWLTTGIVTQLYGQES